jgi:replication factor C small subunit
MTTVTTQELKLADKYRPQSLDEIKGQDEVVTRLKSIVKRKTVPHLLFVGPPGGGKTTAAECVAKAIFGDTWRSYFTVIDASNDRGIDTIRNRVKTLSELVGRRIIFLDECDQLSSDAQWALRGIMYPQVPTDAIFILAANRESKIFDAIKSRCAIFRFQKLPIEVVRNALASILKSEGIQLDVANEVERKQIIAGFNFLAESCDGDLRSAINTIESLITSNKKLTVKDIAFLQKSKVATEAMRTALKGDFSTAKELFETSFANSGDAAAVCEELYDSILLLPKEIKDHVKVRLYAKLAEHEARVRAGSDPKIQLVGFFAFCYLAPHLKDGFPQ